MGDYHIRMQFDIAADEATVRRALTTQDGIAGWWSSKSTITAGSAGRRLEVSFPDQPQPFEFALRDDGASRIDWVTGAYPPWWAGTTIRWDLGPLPDDGGSDASGTRLLFSHRDYDPDNPVIPIITPAWAQIILRLKALAESDTRQPFFDF